MIRLKSTVRLLGLRPEMVLAHTIIASIYAHHDHDCVITTGIEGTHSVGSEHYTGLALDYRLNDIHPPEDRGRITVDAIAALGKDFDVLREGAGTEQDHLHVEWDPKTPY